MGVHYFVGIGITDYQDFPKLPNAAKDITDVANILQTKYQFTEDNTIILLNKEATRNNIIALLEDLIKKVSDKDSLLIYFSGHGHLTRNNERGFWIPVDAELSNTSTYIRNSTIRDYIADIKSLHTLLISDACFSGSIFVRGLKTSSTSYDKLYQTPSRWGLTSGRHDEYVNDGKRGTNSPFAKSILDILKENGDKKLYVLELINHVTARTRSESLQTPEGNPLFQCGHKGGQFTFFEKSAVPALENKALDSSPETHSIPTTNKNVKEETPPLIPPQYIKYIIGLLVLVIIMSWMILSNLRNTSNTDVPIENMDNIPSNETPTISYQTFTDVRDKQQYNYFMAKDSNLWMTENLRHQINTGKYFPEKQESLVDSFGYYYMWDEAMQACPDGWHLPSQEQWENFALQYGGFYDAGDYTEEDGRKGYKALIGGGNSGFNATLSGFYDNDDDFFNLDYSGHYWTSTALSAFQNEGVAINGEVKDNAMVMDFVGGRDTLIRSTYQEKSNRLSCRCIKSKE